MPWTRGMGGGQTDKQTHTETDAVTYGLYWPERALYQHAKKKRLLFSIDLCLINININAWKSLMRFFPTH